MAGFQSAKRLCQCWHAISGSLPAIGSITRTSNLSRTFSPSQKDNLRRPSNGNWFSFSHSYLQAGHLTLLRSLLNSGIVAQELLDDAERRVAGSPSRTTCLPLPKRIPSAKITVDC